ncbi:MAG: hypothetical protein DRO15_05105 [Thermoprotei archaeon]|nr:MAG: hypothetical protein DRO15_05105 [Thermoprotei archaeon]
MVVKLIEELSKSKSKRHAIRRMGFIVKETCEIERPRGRSIPIKPLYAQGEAHEVYVNIPPDAYAVQLIMIKCLRNRVKGCIEVFSSDGRLLLRVKYQKFKVRKSVGDSKYSWIVDKIIKHLKIPVRRMNIK